MQRHGGWFREKLVALCVPWSTGAWDRGWLGRVMLPAQADGNLVLLAMGSHIRLVNREGSRAQALISERHPPGIPGGGFQRGAGMQGQWGSLCAVSLSHPSVHLRRAMWMVGADTWASGLGTPPVPPPPPTPPPPRPLVCLREKLNLDASLDIGGLSELHQSDGERRSRCGNSTLGLWHEH